MSAVRIQDTLAFKLMVSIVELVKNSGASRQEAVAAIKATEAMISEVELLDRPTLEIQSHRTGSPSV